MPAVNRFEELIAWQKARVLVAEVYLMTSKGAFRRDRGFADQIQRAAVSVMSNVAEGFERGSPRDFHRFLVIAKGSCAEVRSQLYAAQDVGYIDPDESRQLIDLASEVGRVINGLRASLQR